MIDTFTKDKDSFQTYIRLSYCILHPTPSCSSVCSSEKYDVPVKVFSILFHFSRYGFLESVTATPLFENKFSRYLTDLLQNM